MSYSYWPSQTGVKQLYGKYVVTLLTEETPLGAVEVIVRKFQITDDKVFSVCVCVCACYSTYCSTVSYIQCIYM